MIGLKCVLLGLILGASFLTSAKPALAKKRAICYLPKDCLTVKGTEFSTGGNSNVWYVEVLCETPRGLRVYIDGDFGLRLLGRLSIPKVIELHSGTGEYLDCKL